MQADALVLSRQIEHGELRPSELMARTLSRIAAINPQVNAIVSLRDHEALMQEAKAADTAPRKGWLHGIPMAIKDLSNVAGLPTTKGSPLFDGIVSDRDDLVVRRLRASGAIIIGKTNTPEFGLGSHTYNPVFGATRNPYDLRRSAGGSSGGAAVALSTGMVSLADGSDMMGSLRNPAAWNNIYGMRPTFGVVPDEPDGEIFLDQLSTLGPMARSPSDLAALLDTMAGRDPGWPHGYQIDATLPGLSEAVPAPRIGWLSDWGGGLPMEAGVIPLCEEALGQMAQIGWHVETPAPLFDLDAMWRAWVSLRSFSIAGARRMEAEDPARRDKLKPAMIWEIENGLALSAMDVHAQSLVRSDWCRVALRAFGDFDVLALPSAQVWPFEIDLIHPDEIGGVYMDTYHRWMQVVVPASLIGLPAISIPVGFGANGLPMGMQLIGRPGSDGMLLRLAEVWHQMTKWPQTRPPVLGG